MSPRVPALFVLAVVSLLVVACSGSAPGSQTGAGGASTAGIPTIVIPDRYALQQSPEYAITVTTTSIGGTFGRLDRRHSCERGDTSPHLQWEGAPEGTQSLALVMEDPASDVHGFSVDVLWAHWVVYSIPPDVTELEPGQTAGQVLDNGARQGSNDYGRIQYNGPCPIPSLRFPSGQQPGEAGSAVRSNLVAEERPYYFKIYALDISVDLPPGANRDTLLEVIDSHILAAGELAVPYKSVNSASCRVLDTQACLETVRR